MKFYNNLFLIDFFLQVLKMKEDKSEDATHQTENEIGTR